MKSSHIWEFLNSIVKEIEGSGIGLSGGDPVPELTGTVNHKGEEVWHAGIEDAATGQVLYVYDSDAEVESLGETGHTPQDAALNLQTKWRRVLAAYRENGVRKTFGAGI